MNSTRKLPVFAHCTSFAFRMANMGLTGFHGQCLVHEGAELGEPYIRR